jgi:calnexin
MKQNPAYKGKWHAPMIDNPKYKGIWKPQEIPNPEYFELDRPDFDAIAAIGIEIWTMQDGILFDNILIADDEKVATSILEKTWKPKFDVEKEKQKAEQAANAEPEELSEIQKKIFDILYKIAFIPFLEPYKTQIIELIEKGEKQPNITISIVASVVVVLVSVLFRTLFGGKKAKAPVKPAAAIKKPTAPEADAAGSSGDKEEKEDEKDDTAAPRRRSRRET